MKALSIILWVLAFLCLFACALLSLRNNARLEQMEIKLDKITQYNCRTHRMVLNFYEHNFVTDYPDLSWAKVETCGVTND